MKRVFQIIVVFAMLVSLLVSCGKPVNSNSTVKTGLSITASFYPMYIFTKSVAKGVDGVTVSLMSQQQTGCLHDYQMTPGDMDTLTRSDIFIVNGAGMEAFLPKVQQNMPRLKIVEASKGIELLPGGADGPNAHLWVSVMGAMAEVQNIADGLSAIDPAHSAEYKSNSEAFITQLQALQEKMKKALKVSNPNIVTFHEAFPYFAQEFGLNIVAQIESEPGAEPGAGQVADYIKTIKSANVKALFVDIQYTSSTAEVISRETGSKLYPLNAVVDGPPDADGGEYISIMEENLKTLSEALK